jgi:hypothetical protein
MIPAELVEFIHGPYVTFVGTRDERMRPSISWAFGAVADAAKGTITFFLPNVEGEAILNSLSQNGSVALTITDTPGDHHSIQFKGKHIESRPSTETEMAFQDNYKVRLIEHFRKMGIPNEFFGGFSYYPSTAVSFRVEEIFDQTPGPGAGGKVDFTPDP